MLKQPKACILRQLTLLTIPDQLKFRIVAPEQSKNQTYQSTYKLKIGIDLDNTIIDYSEVLNSVAKNLEFIDDNWSGSKEALKFFLKTKDNGLFLWEKVQGLAYGKFIFEASLFPGVIRFLWLCKQRKIEVHVISHKTVFGHHDSEGFLLREQAKKFLTAKGVLKKNTPRSLITSLTFCDTREQKIKIIKTKNLDYFIDDLDEIINHPKFPKSVQKILFTPYKSSKNLKFKTIDSWQSLQTLLIPNYKISELQKYCDILNIGTFESAKRLNSGINSSTYALYFEASKLILKIYPQDSKYNRLKKEYAALSFLNKAHFRNIPNIMAKNTDLGIMVLSYIEGRTVSKPKFNMIQECLNFITDLQQIKKKINPKSGIGSAKDAFLSVDQIFSTVEKRRYYFSQSKNKRLHAFLIKEFDPFLLVIKEKILKANSNGSYSWNKSATEKILSPSDFGFHNIIVSKTNKLNFIDFEYFGLDHPLKLLIDFAIHPGFTLGIKERRTWIDGSLNSYAQGLENELDLIWPVFGLIWVLILLNAYRMDSIENKLINKHLTRQLEKAELLLKSIKKFHNMAFREVDISA